MKAILAFAAAMTLLAGTASAFVPRARVATCTTQGDALGGLTIYFEKATVVAIKESTMEGKTLVYRAATSAQDWAAFRVGRDVSFVWYPSNANAFGGAITNASILTLHTRAGTDSRGFLTRAGTVYFLNCKN